MPQHERVATMRRLPLSLSARSVPAALAALVALGLALHGDVAKGRLGSLDDRAPSAPLVNALGEEDLGKFAVVDMVDALGRVAGADGARHTSSD